MTALSLARTASLAAQLPVQAAPPTASGGYHATLHRLVAEVLAPQVLDIDLKAAYPEGFLRELGAAGGFGGAASPEHGGNGLGLMQVIETMDLVSQTCLSTGFLVWCQTACARYIEMSENAELKRDLLPHIARGALLAGTGLSNTVKSCDAVEAFRLSARRVEGGYVINGVLPWVSNLGPDHVFATGCPVEAAGPGDDGLVFIIVDCNATGFKMVDCAHFMAIDGTRTLACHFKNTFVPDGMVLSHPGQSKAYVRRIKPGMILGQMGMCLGLAQACLDLMKQSNRTHAHVNRYLDDQVDDLAPELADLRDHTLVAARTLQANPLADIVLDILKLRLRGGELALRAAQSALLHLGAKGYLQKSPAQRRVREAYFVAIVTPATKHLRREIARLESGQAVCAA
ncbi:MAG: acyl-CoA dehydrogenase family protein [Thiomonas delicata]|uniref:Putative acyl-CoA dehydrogenase n=1 Tax=Thiomonas delicata TaxID=364030 RepID=A0A238D427_THIDL|nr:acyl-CoA dehydrogenase family protein [Thiomonas delicata]MDE2185640.1 acyl-CoA/acyl-ACP dehydrogenase [Betaproteobacteria bacterium]SBP87930.1 putative acyl-CoA dehydrogenase [Thiomonas delicata]